MVSSAAAAHWRLARRYGGLPFRSPVNETLAELLGTVFSEEEARLVSSFPIRPAPTEVIAKRAGLPPGEADSLLRGMDQRGAIASLALDGQTRYALLPIIPGLYELTLWSGRTDAKVKRFAELAELYYNSSYFTTKAKGLVKIIAVEKHIDSQVGVLPTDRVSELISSHSRFSLTACCCRHSADLRGEPCAKPKDVCMAFGPLADFLVARNLARTAEKSEMLEAAHRAVEAGLVHLTDNLAQANFLCSCCSCCCTGMKIITSFNYPWMIANSHFVALLDHNLCEACGRCAGRCPTGALQISGPAIRFDENRCIGCGVCISACNRNHALSLVTRPRYEPPNARLGQLAADCGLQSIGLMRTIADRFPGAYRRLRQTVEKGLIRSLG